MAINIKDSETDHLAREVAHRTGETITDAIRVALQERLQRLSGRQHAATTREKIGEILRRVDALSTQDHRSEDEILGYDENGIPQ
ncbi:MAG TPA: type II toxin-antitoxin system VapB family antitoxin [Candidatus Angelobacter sp.]|jgi:antitoxin VapB|nr:type II toxin-antitoxin system VapB family antitoxin [Candidatus Angelobacter sp.]